MCVYAHIYINLSTYFIYELQKVRSSDHKNSCKLSTAITIATAAVAAITNVVVVDVVAIICIFFVCVHFHLTT